jgi:hypothetical protein
MSLLGGIIGAATGFFTSGGNPLGAVAGGLAGLSAGGQQQAAQAQSQAAGQAAAAQSQAAAEGIAEQRRQFDATQKLLSPYVQAGTPALQQQQAFLGLSGQPAQQKAIQGIEQSPQFTSLLQQGENAMLQNAAATGGLRGGNVQGALAQFRPQLLNQLLEQQYSRLGGLTSLGQQSAAGQATAGMQSGANIATLLGQQGQAQAGGILGQNRAQAMQANIIPQAIGQFAGMGGFGGFDGIESVFNKLAFGPSGSPFSF